MKRRSMALVLLVGLTTGLAVPASAGEVDFRFITKWGTAGSGDGEFNFLWDLALAPDETVYVADGNNDRIQYFSPTGVFLGEWGTAGNADGQFNTPSAVAVAPDGTVYVTDEFNYRIQYFSPTGTFLGKWGQFGTNDAQFAQPRGVAVAGDGTVYVVDTGNNRIQHFGPTGTFLRKWGSAGSGDGEFGNPRGVAVAPNGNVYIADQFRDRIQFFTSTGGFLGKWGTNGPFDGQMIHPVRVAVADDGTVYVAEVGNDRVQYFSPTGVFLGKWGTDGTADGQFKNPYGVGLSPFGAIYVPDQGNNRIQKFAFVSETRAAGVNRYATAAEISKLHHPNPDAVDTVFVATGANFPDALAGAVAAAAAGSPLLLTGSVPQVTADELDRLDPDKVVILGGTAVVDPATATTLSGWGDITRLAGANRYETAVAISQYLYPTDGSADTVVIATGTGFADALAGASLAASRNGPVLLTPPGALPAAVAAEIGRLDPDQIIVLGGEAAVSAAVFTHLQGLAPTSRVAGANRYATAVEISKNAFPGGAGVVYIAVGTNFPDALAGAAQAAASGSPILLTTTNALPAEVVAEITRLDPYTIIILGGTAVISQAVENQLKALLGL